MKIKKIKELNKKEKHKMSNNTQNNKQVKININGNKKEQNNNKNVQSVVQKVQNLQNEQDIQENQSTEKKELTPNITIGSRVQNKLNKQDVAKNNSKNVFKHKKNNENNPKYNVASFVNEEQTKKCEKFLKEENIEINDIENVYSDKKLANLDASKEKIYIDEEIAPKELKRPTPVIYIVPRLYNLKGLNYWFLRRKNKNDLLCLINENDNIDLLSMVSVVIKRQTRFLLKLSLFLLLAITLPLFVAYILTLFSIFKIAMYLSIGIILFAVSLFIIELYLIIVYKYAMQLKQELKEM